MRLAGCINGVGIAGMAGRGMGEGGGIVEMEGEGNLLCAGVSG